MAFIPTDANQYITQAVSNWNFLSYLATNRSNQYDWMITIQYYFILHLLKAHLIDQGIIAGLHSDVKREIGHPAGKPTKMISDKFLTDEISPGNPLWVHYEVLEEYSRRARYLGIKGYHHPIDVNTLSDAGQETDRILHYFLQSHPKIAQAPFNALRSLQPIALVLPKVPVWQALSGLLAIHSI